MQLRKKYSNWCYQHRVMITPLNPLFNKRIDDAFEELYLKQIQPWIMLASGKPMRVKKFSNEQISYQGTKFQGSPEHVFWSRYIEPFMEEIVISEIRKAAIMARDKKVDGEVLLGEVRDLLLTKIKDTFKKMVDIDQRLNGEGFPERAQRRSIDSEFNAMKEFVDLHIRAEQEMWHRNRFERLYQKNKLFVWVLTPVLAGLVWLVFGRE